MTDTDPASSIQKNLAKPEPSTHATQTPSEIVERALYLCSKYHLESIRIVWYLVRYHGIKISGACVSFFNLLKRERIRRRTYHTREEARQNVFDYIEMFYNPKCKHAHTEMLPPSTSKCSKN